MITVSAPRVLARDNLRTCLTVYEELHRQAYVLCALPALCAGMCNDKYPVYDALTRFTARYSGGKVTPASLGTAAALLCSAGDAAGLVRELSDVLRGSARGVVTLPCTDRHRLLLRVTTRKHIQTLRMAKAAGLLNKLRVRVTALRGGKDVG